MTTPAEPDGPPPPEWLAGYADGELGPDAVRRVRAWLAGHPDAAAEAAAQARFSPRNRRLWQAAEPPRPGDADWADLADRVARAAADARNAPRVAPTPPPGKSGGWRPRLRLWATGLVGAGLAAGLALAVVSPPTRPPAPPAAEDEHWSVARPGDVEVMSVRAADAWLLVVGDPPGGEPIVLAAADEVQLHTMEPADGMVPQMPPMKGGDVPMVVVVAGRRP